jgi:hypothetical protein
VEVGSFCHPLIAFMIIKVSSSLLAVHYANNINCIVLLVALPITTITREEIKGKIRNRASHLDS